MAEKAPATPTDRRIVDDYVTDLAEFEKPAAAVEIDLQPNSLLDLLTNSTLKESSGYYTCFYGFMFLLCFGAFVWEGLSNLCVSIDTCKDEDESRSVGFAIVDICTTIAFAFEVMLRYWTVSDAFLRDSFNLFDVCILAPAILCSLVSGLFNVPVEFLLSKTGLMIVRYAVHFCRVVAVVKRRVDHRHMLAVAKQYPVDFETVQIGGSGPVSRSATPFGTRVVLPGGSSPRFSASQQHSPRAGRHEDDFSHFPAYRTNVYPQEESPLLGSSAHQKVSDPAYLPVQTRYNFMRTYPMDTSDDATHASRSTRGNAEEA